MLIRYVSQLPHSDLDNGFFFKKFSRLLTGLEPSGPVTQLTILSFSLSIQCKGELLTLIVEIVQLLMGFFHALRLFILNKMNFTVVLSSQPPMALRSFQHPV